MRQHDDPLGLFTPSGPTEYLEVFGRATSLRSFNAEQKYGKVEESSWLVFQRFPERRVGSLEKEIASLRNEMNARFDALESKVTLVEDVTRLRMKVKALAETVAAIAPS